MATSTSTDQGRNSTSTTPWNQSAIRTLEDHGHLNVSPTALKPKLLCRTLRASQSQNESKTYLVVHSHLRRLHLFVDDHLQQVWGFEEDIISFCWNDTNDEGETISELPLTLLVATKDERVWSLVVLSKAAKKDETIQAEKRKDSDGDVRTVIKIEDSDEDEVKVEEIELWNDEDGLLEDSFDQIQETTLPPSKRQRIESPTRTDIKTEVKVEVANVDATKDLIDLESQNARIVKHNRILQTLQAAILTPNGNEKQDDLPAPLMDVVVTAFVRNIAKGATGQRRYVAQITFSSSLDIDWSQSWTAAIRTLESRDGCSHGKTLSPSLQREVFVSLTGLSRKNPLTQEIELDVPRMRLPIKMDVGLHYHEELTVGKSRFSTYFFIESFELDALHFAEPSRETFPGMHSSHNIPSSADQQTLAKQSSHAIVRELVDSCQLCKDASGRESREPLAFTFETTEIQLAQCLSAVLGDCLPEERTRTLIQSAMRAAVIIPDSCLSYAVADSPHANTNTNAFNMNDDAHTTVWIQLEEKAHRDTFIEASMQVRGADPMRVAVVHRALKERLAMLFD
ncbi:hypothetical protein BGZ83_004819 [Gryganskiella cystojenkinii]|nr:hypothetical protein BGZ83_004819 [Gryganskiella cystojenkinii]